MRPSSPRRLAPVAAVPLLVALAALAGCSSTPDTVERGAPVLPSGAPSAPPSSTTDTSPFPSTGTTGSTTAQSSATTTSPSGQSPTAGATGASSSNQPITDGLTTVGDITGGMIPVYDAQVLHEGSSVRWRQGEKLSVGYLLTSPTVKALEDCGTQLALTSDDQKFHKEDWTAYRCDEADGYYHFSPDRIGGYTLEFKGSPGGSAKGMELRQRIHFTMTD